MELKRILLVISSTEIRYSQNLLNVYYLTDVVFKSMNEFNIDFCQLFVVKFHYYYFVLSVS